MEGDPNVWYNPIKGYVIPKDFIGKKVILTVDDKRIIADVRLDVPEAPKPTIIRPNESLLIIRQVAAKCAAEITAQSPNATIDFFKKTASEIEAWILR